MKNNKLNKNEIKATCEKAVELYFYGMSTKKAIEMAKEMK